MDSDLEIRVVIIGAALFLVSGPPIATMIWPPHETLAPCAPGNLDCRVQVPQTAIEFDNVPVALYLSTLLLEDAWRLRSKLRHE